MSPAAASASSGWTVDEDRGPEERTGGHAEERQRADDAEGARASRAAEQVRRGRRPDRDEDAAADRLDEPGRDELVEVLRHPASAEPSVKTTSAAMNSRRAPHRSAIRPAIGIARM